MIWDRIVAEFSNPPQIKELQKVPDPTHKTCCDCAETKPLTEFYPRKIGAKYTSRCKPCYMAYNKKLKEKKRGKTI